jgi:hypothetical protein
MIPADLKTTQAELDQLAAIFGVTARDPKFAEILEALATAALQEYTLAFSGTRSPGTLREARELRLRLLFEHLPGGGPTDTQVAQLMQLTPSAARTLIAGTRARYRTQLDEILRAAAVEALKESTRGDDEDTARVVLPDSLAVYVRDLADETRTPPLKKSDAISLTWEIKRSTAEVLGKRLGFTVGELNGFKKK